MKLLELAMSRRVGVVVLTGLLFCIGLCACTTSGGITRAQIEQDKRVVLAGPAKMKISIASVHTRFNNGLLEVQLNGLNKSFRDIQLHYKIDWLDEAGFQVATPNSAWLMKRITGKEPFQLSALAQSPKIKNFKFFLK